MRPVTLNPNNPRASFREIESASHDADIVEIGQNFTFDDPTFTEVFELLTGGQPDAATALLLHFESYLGPYPSYSTGTWTPALTFDTPGDLAVTYTTQTGFYQRIGQTVIASFSILTSSFTWSTSAGSLRVTGFPFPVVASGIQRGPVVFGPITFGAGYTDIVCTADIASPGQASFRLSGAAVGVVVADTTNFPSGANRDLRSTVAYQTTDLGAVTFADSSAQVTPITTHGSVSLSTAQKEFGNSSALFDGSTGYLTFASGSNYTFQGDFTIDLWVRPTADAAVMEVVGKANAAGISPVLISSNADGTWRLSASSAGVAYDIISNQIFGALTVNTWQHLAVVKSGNDWFAFVNGVQGYTTTSALLPNNTSDVLSIGARNDGTNPFAGYIDEFRFSTTPRWTAAFTPSTIAYDEPTIGNTAAVLATLLLIMQKGGRYRTT